MAMRDTKLDILATLFGLARGEYAPGDYEDDEDLGRRIHLAARHGPSRGAIATMGVTVGDPGVAEGGRSVSRPGDAAGDAAALNVGGSAPRDEQACVFCDRPGRQRAAGLRAGVRRVRLVARTGVARPSAALTSRADAVD